MRRTLTLILLLLAGIHRAGAGKGDGEPLQPRLVVGIVVDQMRYDYLYRFYDQYGENGFKRLMREGMNFTWAHYNYVPTYTGPGHSTIYTGTPPCNHGIISNDWYDRKSGKTVYCSSDPDVKAVGSSNANGRMSPKNLLGTTMTDQLRLSNNGLSRVFAISIKDRASVLPGGHMANAAYWYDEKSGNVVTSTWYMQELPAWVNAFNSRKLSLDLMSRDWQLDPAKDYRVSMPDDGPGERDIFREGKTTFPHVFTSLSDTLKREALKATPAGSEFLADLFTDLLKNEQPGKQGSCDFVAVSFSSPDYIGHVYGPNSLEIMDAYLKLDRQIARMLDTLDRYAGKGNYLVFLTADHGVKPNNALLSARRIPAGNVSVRDMNKKISAAFTARFGSRRILQAIQENQVYLDHAVIDSLKLNLGEVTSFTTSFLRSEFPFIGKIENRDELAGKSPERSMNAFLLNGFNIARSGDIVFELTQNQIFSESNEGTSHESSFGYDTHVPMLFFGWHVKAGESNAPVYVVDIAPTVCNLIHIQEPDACIGIPLIKY